MLNIGDNCLLNQAPEKKDLIFNGKGSKSLGNTFRSPHSNRFAAAWFKKKPSYHYVADFVGAQDETNFVFRGQDGLVCPVLP